MLTQILSSLVFILGMVGALSCIIFSFKSYKHTRKLMQQALQGHDHTQRLIEHALKDSQSAFFNMQNEVRGSMNHSDSKLEKIVTLLQDIQCQVRDLNMRVTIAEVRLEERKPQTTLSGLPIPAKRGRKPKQLT